MSACEACWSEAFKRARISGGMQADEYQKLRTEWCLGGSTHSVKRIHAPCCQYAKVVYQWARGKTSEELIDQLVISGAIEWHEACKRCLPDLSVEIATARFDAREAVVGLGAGDGRA